MARRQEGSLTKLSPSSSRSLADTTWQSKVLQAQDTTNRAAKLEFDKDYSAAFEAYVRAGDLYLWLVKNYQLRGEQTVTDLKGTDEDNKKRLKNAAEKVLSRAETIKVVKKDIKTVERSLLSEEEQSRALDDASSIDGIDIPIWTSEPDVSEFEGAIFRDPVPAPSLAPVQRQWNGFYLRRSVCHESLPSWASSPLYDSQRPLRGRDIIQDVVTDCSFVAALEVASEYDARWGTKLSTSPLYPKDKEGHPRWSDNGKHVVRLILNGKPRRVVIDNGVPCQPDGTLLCASGISNRGGTSQVWPALIEKAYLRLRGGYDFVGSNSAMDLHALTGWIPEQIGFRHAGFQREKTWDRLLWAWKEGYIMVTAGTASNTSGKIGQEQVELADSHDYAVLEIEESGGERWMTLMNPWGTAGKRRTGGIDDERWTQDMICSLNDVNATKREIFRVTWNEACMRLDSLYLNWNPEIAKHSTTIHSAWRRKAGGVEILDDERRRGTEQDPQLKLMVEPDESEVPGTSKIDVWLHLVRHITTSDDKASRWIALHVFERESRKKLLAFGNDHRMGTYLDSPHNLVRFRASSQRPSTYTVVVSCNGPNDVSTFTLSVYSAARVSLHDIPRTFAHTKTLEGRWSERSAGGNLASPTFLSNPQYRLTTNIRASSAPIGLSIVTYASKDLPVQALLTWSRGKRVSHVSEGDVVASSGVYNYGLAIAEATTVQPGIYTLTVSTFDPGQTGNFTICVQSSVPVSIEELPGEGAGMFQRALRGEWIKGHNAMGAPSHGNYAANPSFLLVVDKLSTFSLRLRTSSIYCPMPYLNVAIFRESGKEKAFGSEVASSGPYSDFTSGVSIEDLKLEEGRYLIVPSTFSPNVEGEFSIVLYSDKPITCGRA